MLWQPDAGGKEVLHEPQQHSGTGAWRSSLEREKRGGKHRFSMFPVSFLLSSDFDSSQSMFSQCFSVFAEKYGV